LARTTSLRARAVRITRPLPVTLWMPRCAAQRSDGGSEVRFAVHVRNDNREGTPPLVRLKAYCGQVTGQEEERVPLCMQCRKLLPTDPRAFRAAMRSRKG
jgi:hypothetical protein